MLLGVIRGPGSRRVRVITGVALRTVGGRHGARNIRLTCEHIQQPRDYTSQSPAVTTFSVIITRRTHTHPPPPPPKLTMVTSVAYCTPHKAAMVDTKAPGVRTVSELYVTTPTYYCTVQP